MTWEGLAGDGNDARLIVQLRFGVARRRWLVVAVLWPREMTVFYSIHKGFECLLNGCFSGHKVRDELRWPRIQAE